MPLLGAALTRSVVSGTGDSLVGVNVLVQKLPSLPCRELAALSQLIQDRKRTLAVGTVLAYAAQGSFILSPRLGTPFEHALCHRGGFTGKRLCDASSANVLLHEDWHHAIIDQPSQSLRQYRT